MVVPFNKIVLLPGELINFIIYFISLIANVSPKSADKTSFLRKLRRASKRSFGTSLSELGPSKFDGTFTPSLAIPNIGHMIISRGSTNLHTCTILDK